MRFILHFPQSKMDSLSLVCLVRPQIDILHSCKFEVGLTEIIRINTIVMLFILSNFRWTIYSQDIGGYVLLDSAIKSLWIAGSTGLT